MLEKVTCNGKVYELLPQIYWHISPKRGVALYNNVFLHQGFLATISRVNQIPGLENAVSPYSIRAGADEKEIEWERVRKETNPVLPTRKGAFFAAESKQQAELMSETWFKAEERNLLELRVVSGSTICRADSKWLDGLRADWKENALRYWAGDVTNNPVLEILIHGAVYFPKWRKPPFGVMASLTE